ncbi:MAG: hypothetical protein IPK33_13035 [Gemmatimonadetes bacterium]|nr:hypothetical protein [Gemmatimonadota bacterium]
MPSRDSPPLIRATWPLPLSWTPRLNFALVAHRTQVLPLQQGALQVDQLLARPAHLIVMPLERQPLRERHRGGEGARELEDGGIQHAKAGAEERVRVAFGQECPGPQGRVAPLRAAGGSDLADGPPRARCSGE